jgi:hypothetical protein
VIERSHRAPVANTGTEQVGELGDHSGGIHMQTMEVDGPPCNPRAAGIPGSGPRASRSHAAVASSVGTFRRGVVSEAPAAERATVSP